MTKSARIMALHQQGKSTREIAIAVFGTLIPTQANCAYVRVVKGQRKGSMSPADRAYAKTEPCKIYRRKYTRDWARNRYQTDPVYRQRKIAAVTAYRAARIG